MSTADKGPLAARHCQPCEGGTKPLAHSEATAFMKELSAQWKLAPDALSIHGEWKFRNFFHTMSFVNAVAHIANTEDHHPDLEVGYNYCRMKFTTHAIGGLSANDFICAAKVDGLPLG